MKKLNKDYSVVENTVEAYLEGCFSCSCRICSCPCSGGVTGLSSAQGSGDMNNLSARHSTAVNANWAP